MTVFLDLFSGIGGFALGAYWAGLRFAKHYFSEIEPYAVELYQKRFPNAEPLGDIRNVDYTRLPKGEYLVTGGFPCQPHSVAGKRKGKNDKRDLWIECRRMLRELQPAVALFENVRGIFTTGNGEFFNGVLSDIHNCGYDAEWQIISASEIGAAHKRERVWIICWNSNNGNEQAKQEIQRRKNTDTIGICRGISNAEGKTKRGFSFREKKTYAGIGILCGDASDTRHDGAVKRQQKLQKNKQIIQTENNNRTGKIINEGWKWWKVEPDVGRVADGIPFRVDKLTGLGNSIVPQCVELIFNLPAFDCWRK